MGVYYLSKEYKATGLINSSMPVALSFLTTYYVNSNNTDWIPNE
jgi:hypothetical protein